MNRIFNLICTAALFIAPTICNGQDYRNHTLDFVDLTSTNINQTVAESTLNEKHVEFGDFDNDGDMDVVIAVAQGDVGERKNKMYINNGGVFDEVSGTSMMPEFSNTSTSRSAHLRDFDDDGWLDLIIVNDSDAGNGNNQSPGTTKFFRNKQRRGAFSHFENETERLDGASGAAYSSVAFDLDQNGLHDLFMANSPSQDTMYFNGINGNPAGEFLTVTGTHVPVETDHAVDVNAGDLNGDSKLDLLINSNGHDTNYILYNDNMGDGSGIGDFSYNTARQKTSFPSTNFEGAMCPADFDCDGKVDFLFVNKGGFSSGSDVIMRNTGNDSNNKAEFEEINLPFGVSSETKKATIVDLDGDHKLDIILMAENRRPYIYRNASQPGMIKFIEWTPGSAFPNDAGGGPHTGWHAEAFDTDGDARPEIFVGALEDDHLFKNQTSTFYEEDNLTGGVIPVVFHNNAPVTVIGTGSKDELDLFRGNGIPQGARVSVFLRSFGDVELHVKDENAFLIATIDDGLAHVAETFEFTAPGGQLIFAVATKQVSGDGNMDGQVTLQDARMLRLCYFSTDPECLIFDLNGSGRVTLADARLFRSVFQVGQAKGEYILEVNSRSD